jgi:hypothetical protein
MTLAWQLLLPKMIVLDVAAGRVLEQVGDVLLLCRASHLYGFVDLESSTSKLY